MNNSFEVTKDDAVIINNAAVTEAQMDSCVVGMGLPEDFGQEAQMKAELIERRLSRIEKFLNLTLIS